ncbi:hypothetical protein A5681_14350 [Mycobacterium scrofulaceum]|uniref:hypothetical protein n=1 Tax=Mycobacterium scrofulaceum TaxID=1783 RepID=UPI000802201C|nr:hypothetical protein [Mycobacterium scrofulaceum]OBH86940.1 hypothetical protein A5681_14350 [Mycobacterium scrofulaceum]
MARDEGGRWDVGIKDDAVFVQRVSDADEQLFIDSLDSDEARKLAELLTKFADKLDNSDKSADSEKGKDKDKKDKKDKGKKDKDKDKDKDSEDGDDEDSEDDEDDEDDDDKDDTDSDESSD